MTAKPAKAGTRKKPATKPERAERRVETPADRRNYLRKQAGWPVKE